MTLCVYALVTVSRARLHITGVFDERLRAVSVTGIAAVVGEVKRQPAASTRNLRRYAAIVEAIAARVPAVLPVRFGTTFDDAAELSLVLRARQASIRRRLRAVRGRVQMTIRLLSEAESGEASRPSHTRAGSPARVGAEHNPTHGTQYLQQRAAAIRTANDVTELAPIRDVVRRLVKDERIERHRGITTVHHLIPRASAERYRLAVADAATKNSIRLVVGGPWAPYAFADNW